MNVLEVRSVSKQYATVHALNKVSLQVEEGSIFGLLGPNGAGKTSLIRIITQITKADTGEVLFMGSGLKPEHTQQIGYLPEERGLYKKMEVGEQLLYFAQLKGLSRASAMDKLKSWIERFEIQSWWNKKVEELSKGMQQKVQFIATVMHAPKLLILDEPFSGFDPINAAMITSEILGLKANGTSIIFSTHRMESVEQLCDRIGLIHQSNLVLEGKVSNLREQYKKSIYEVTHTPAELTSLTTATVLGSHTNGQRQTTSIQLAQHIHTNQVISELLQLTSILGFEEKLPSMQDIFIDTVNKAN